MKSTKFAVVAVTALTLTVALLVQNDGEARSGFAPSSSQPPNLPAVVAAAPADWSITFDDEFDGDQLGAQWTTCFWWQVDDGCTIASNEELEWYLADGVSVVDGILRLQATADPQRTTDGVSLPFRSGMVSTGPAADEGTAAGYTFTYGYVEVIVRFPTGGGTWPAVWLLSADLTSTPEIDIVERYGDEPIVKSRVHQRVDGDKESQGLEATLVPTTDGWHRVGVLWAPDRVEFFLDDVLTGIIDDERLVPGTPMYVIINLAMGGRAGAVDGEALPQQFEIDRIRVWQQQEAE
jgi:beta-glucanase (GH16 family)